jgi:hypothetical protein
MAFLSLPFSYLAWHYSRALADIWGIGTNFIWFFYHWFSVPELGRTLVAPWRRLGEGYRSGFHPGQWLATLFINFLMRLIGLGCRLGLLALAFLTLTLTLGLTLLTLAIWLLVPLGLLGFLRVGFSSLIQ